MTNPLPRVCKFDREWEVWIIHIFEPYPEKHMNLMVETIEIHDEGLVEDSLGPGTFIFRPSNCGIDEFKLRWSSVFGLHRYLQIRR
jgi:hypothetical protein